MSLNPKLEFYKFKLKAKSKEFKTFKDFAKEKLDLSTNDDTQIMQELFKYFLESLDSDLSIDEKLKKRIALIKDEEVNKYLKFRPKLNSNDFTISGVINGGSYGRERILSNNEDINSSSEMNENDSVLQYYYFTLYIPLDHEEGCFILHSNSASENITKVFRRFISKIFDHSDYYKINAELFSPISFQNEFKEESNIQNISFRNSFVDNVPSTQGVGYKLNEYDIILKIIPKDKNIPIKEVGFISQFFSKFSILRKGTPDKVSDFNQTKFEVKNKINKTTKTFEWNTKDNEFAPVIYLDGRIENFNLDGTPDFGELDSFCMNLFSSDILPELRPDFNVKRIN